MRLHCAESDTKPQLGTDEDKMSPGMATLQALRPAPRSRAKERNVETRVSGRSSGHDWWYDVRVKRAIAISLLTTAAFSQELPTTTQPTGAHTLTRSARGNRVFLFQDVTGNSSVNGAMSAREKTAVRKHRELVFFWQDGMVKSAVKETVPVQRKPEIGRRGERVFFWQHAPASSPRPAQ